VRLLLGVQSGGAAGGCEAAAAAAAAAVVVAVAIATVAGEDGDVAAVVGEGDDGVGTQPVGRPDAPAL